MTRTPETQTESPSAQELLGCPFCGGDARYESVYGNVDEQRWSVGCMDEDCFGYMSFSTYPRKTDALKAWNTRTAATVSAEREAEVERLRAALKHIAFVGIDPGIVGESAHFYKRQLCECISTAARAIDSSAPSKD